MNAPSPIIIAKARRDVLKWYDKHGRELPWRISSGVGRPEPYHTLLSEFMLQQTVVKTAIPYFERFLALWPSLDALGVAHEEEVLEAWAGLGYYSRARNLHKTARLIIEAGAFPRQPEELAALPGIGPYTANAIAAIAFDKQVLPLDANILRVLSRIHGVDLPRAKKPQKEALCEGWAQGPRPGDLAQALMDIGAEICKAKRADCPFCPLAHHCASHKMGDPLAFPRPEAKREKKRSFGHGFILSDETGKIALEKRQQKGPLRGLWALPSGDWCKAPEFAPPMEANWERVGELRHIFTHIDLRLTLWHARIRPCPEFTRLLASPGYRWIEPNKDAVSNLPRLWSKALELLP